MPEYLSRGCTSIIRGLLQQYPSNRTSIKSLRESDWLRAQLFPIR